MLDTSSSRQCGEEFLLAFSCHCQQTVWKTDGGHGHRQVCCVWYALIKNSYQLMSREEWREIETDEWICMCSLKGNNPSIPKTHTNRNYLAFSKTRARRLVCQSLSAAPVNSDLSPVTCRLTNLCLRVSALTQDLCLICYSLFHI